MFDGTFWRGIIHDPHYLVPATGIVICIIYMLARFIYVEKTSPHQPNIENNGVTRDTTLTNNIMANEEKSTSGDTYNVTSQGQTGGITAGRIDKVVTSDEDSINPYTNFRIEQVDSNSFKVKPIAGKWTQPFLMIPRSEKDSISYEFGPESGPSQDFLEGVEEEERGRKHFGTIFSYGSSSPNPATKDFAYVIRFRPHPPSYFVFGDHASGKAFEWRRQ